MTSEAKFIIGTVVISVAILIGGVVFLGGGQQSQQTEIQQQSVDKASLIKAWSHTEGKKDAKVQIVEFSDFQCPACAAAFPVVKRILGEYQDSVSFTYRNFPLPLHVYGKDAALVAEAAGEQGKYWEMHDLLFENQTAWSNGQDPKSIFEGYARQLNLDIEKFKADRDSDALFEKVSKDLQDGRTLSINATPTFFINGQRLVGVPNYQKLKEIIDEERTK